MKNKIVKNTSMLYLLNIAKMIFPLITLPYLTRVLSVQGYGMVAYIKAVMSYMQIIVDFGFLLSGTKDIVLAGNDRNLINKEVSEILFARILLGLLAFIVLCCTIPFIQIVRDNIGYTFLSYTVIFASCFLMDFYFRGIEKMEVTAIMFIVMRGISTLMTFIFVKNDGDIMWIPVLDLIGSIAAVTFVWIEMKKTGVQIKLSRISSIIRKLRESAIYFFSNMATTAFSAFNTLLIGIFINATDVAYWSICMQLIGAVQSLYTPITNGIYPQMIRSKSWELLKKTIRLIMPVVVFGCIFTILFSKQVILIVAGQKYLEAALILRLLVPVLFFSFPAILYGWPALGAINKQRETTITTIVSAAFQTVAVLLLIMINYFNLFTICIVRCVTELVLFSSRFFICIRYRNEFN